MVAEKKDYETLSVDGVEVKYTVIIGRRDGLGKNAETTMCFLIGCEDCGDCFYDGCEKAGSRNRNRHYSRRRGLSEEHRENRSSPGNRQREPAVDTFLEKERFPCSL